MNAVDFRTLTLDSKLAITWSFFWRAIVIGFASMVSSGIAGGIVGFIVGMVLGIAGLPIEWIQVAGGLIGLALGILFGFLFFLLYVQWLLSSRLGRFRLSLVRADGIG